MSEATFTFRVDEALKNEFATAAKARDRTGPQLLRDFMREFVQQQHEASEHDAWFRHQVQTRPRGQVLPFAPTAATRHENMANNPLSQEKQGASRPRQESGSVLTC